AMIVAGPPVVTTTAHRGNSSVWLNHRVTYTFAASSPNPNNPGSRRPPAVATTVTSRPANPRAAARSRKGSPYRSVLSVTCTHGLSVGIASSHAVSTGWAGGCHTHGPT